MLTILEENKSCTWKKLKKKFFIHETLLINALSTLVDKIYIKKNIDTRPFHYHITSEGKDYRNQIVQIIKRKVKLSSIKVNLNLGQKSITNQENLELNEPLLDAEFS